MLKQLTVAKGLKCEVVEEEDMTVHMKVNRKEGGQHSYDICYNPQNVSCTCKFFITQGLPSLCPGHKEGWGSYLKSHGY